jgi:hypothetical protein
MEVRYIVRNLTQLKRVCERTYAGLQERVSSCPQLESSSLVLYENNTRIESKMNSKVTGMKRSLTRNLSRKKTFHRLQ